jgi:predicted metal-dependent HD superfamily phosphohydrolase
VTPELRAAYAEPHRRYHTLEHIEACLALLGEVEGLDADDRVTLERAIWWHDAIYDPTRGDNEDLSADMAVRDLAALGVSAGDGAEVARLIRLTKGHTVDPADRLGALLVSIDLSILGAAPEAYDRYSQQIRQEYAFAPDDLYRAGRAAVMRRFLEAPAIFPSPALANRFEAAARENIRREISRLETASP